MSASKKITLIVGSLLFGQLGGFFAAWLRINYAPGVGVIDSDTLFRGVVLANYCNMLGILGLAIAYGKVRNDHQKSQTRNKQDQDIQAV